MLLAELDARYDEIVCNETVELGGEYTMAEANALDRAIEKLRKIFDVVYN